MTSTKEFHQTLLDALEGIRNEYFSLPDPSAQQKLLLETCRNAAREKDDTVGNNLVNILGHYIQSDNLDYDWVFSFVMQRAASKIDEKMLNREKEDDFDKQFNTLTGTILSQYELPDEVSVERYESSNRYNPTPIASMNMALNRLREYKVKYEDYVFVDIGSGMGRNLLLAASFPFAQIVGVELSAYLHNVAGENIRRYSSPDIKCSNFRLECVNALDFAFPEQNMVLYFWHPFDDTVADKFMAGLERFLAARPAIRCLLVFLEYTFVAVKRSAVFNMIDNFLTPATTVNENSFFPITVFSNR